MKLLLLLSHSGLLSRRKSFDAICAGYVIVNGSVQREPSTDIDESRDRVEYSGKLIQVRKFEYVILNKPRGYVTTCEGQFDQEVVMSLLSKELRHLRPVGRLDKDTEGLLLFMNDGELANRLMHPSFDVEKTYFARVRGRMLPRAVEILQNGIQIEGELTAPARVRIIEAAENETTLEIAIHEGRKHQVRLMCQSVGHHVVTLRRIQQGPIVLGSLPPGQWRHLTYEEVGALKAIRPVRPGASEDAPPEPDRRFLKPLFSTTSEKRRFSTTRSWNSDNDVHAPVPPPKFEPAKRPEPREGRREEGRAPRRDDRRGPRPEGRPPYRRDDRPAQGGETTPVRPGYRRDGSRGPRREEGAAGRPPYRRDESRGPRREGSTEGRPPYRRDESRGPRREGSTEGRPPYRRDESRGPRREGSTEGRPPYRRDESRGPRREGSTEGRPPYRRDDSRAPRREGSAPGRPPYRRDDRPAASREGRPAGASYRPREEKPGEARREFAPRRPFPGKKPFGSAGKKSFGPPGSKPYSSAGKKPFGGSGKKPFGASGSKPFGSAGKKPFGAPGKKPFGAFKGPKKFGPSSGGRARPPRA